MDGTTNDATRFVFDVIENDERPENENVRAKFAIISDDDAREIAEFVANDARVIDARYAFERRFDAFANAKNEIHAIASEIRELARDENDDYARVHPFAFDDVSYIGGSTFDEFDDARRTFERETRNVENARDEYAEIVANVIDDEYATYARRRDARAIRDAFETYVATIRATFDNVIAADDESTFDDARVFVASLIAEYRDSTGVDIASFDSSIIDAVGVVESTRRA